MQTKIKNSLLKQFALLNLAAASLGIASAPASAEIIVNIQSGAIAADAEQAAAGSPASGAMLPGETEYDTFMRLGYGAVELGSYESAALYFRNALYSVPNDREATVAYWNAQDQLVKTPNEGGKFDRFMGIGYDATEQGDYQTALINFRRALELRPQDYYATQAMRNVTTYIERGQDPDSPRDVDAEATFYVGEAPYDRYMRLGYAAVQREDYRSAASQFRNALEMRPSDRQATISYWNAMDGLKDGNYGLGSDNAEPKFDRFMRLGYDATAEQNYARAKSFFEQALAVRPGDSYATQALRNIQTYMAAQ